MRCLLFFVCLTSGLSQLASQSIRSTPKPLRTAANLRVDVDMALVPVTVLDAMGRSVTGLDRGNFKVFDGSREVPIVSFGSQEQPISVGLIFDCSRSMKEKFKTSREAPRALFDQLNADDESFLITVSDRAELRWGLTSDFSELENALIFSHPNGSTSLVDGIYLGLQQIKKSRNPRRALIVVSDGGDNNSRYTLHELESIAVESDTQIFSLGLFGHPQSPEEVDGPELLQALSSRTGGVTFQIQNIKELRFAMEKIGISLHHQYVLGYYPPVSAESGKYRRIKVKLMVPPGAPPMQIYARAGYYVPAK